MALLVERHVTQRESLLDRLVGLIRRILDAVRRGVMTREAAAEQLSTVTASSQNMAAEMSQAFTRATFSLYDETLPADTAPAFNAITTEDEWLTIIEAFLDAPTAEDVVAEAEAIAHDAVTRASNAGAGTKGADFYRRIIHPELSKGGTCGLCVAASHRKYRVADLKPIHAGCVDGSTIVASDAVRGLTRRVYSGQFVIFSTTSGEELTVTPNHPVLTSEGWIPAAFLKKGHEVIRSLRSERMVLGGPNEQQTPTTVEDAWRALTVDHGLHPARVPLASEDFYGDGSDGEVEVVTLERLLPDVGDLSFAQPAAELELVRGWLRGLRLASEGTLPEAALHGGDSAGRAIGRSGERSTLLTRAPGVAVGLSVTEGSSLNSRTAQDATNDAPVNAMSLCNDHLAVAVGVLLHDEVDGQVVPLEPTRFDPAGLEFSGDGRRVYAELGSDLHDRLSGEVFSDQVVDHRVVDGAGHVVYDLWTSEGWFEANSYIVSNCHCGVMGGTKDADPGGDLNEADLKAVYQAAGTTDGWTLKQVRFIRTEDGDLEAAKSRKKRGKRKSADGEGNFTEPTGLPEKSPEWLRGQIAITEATPSSDWRTKQLARLRAELAKR